MDSEICIPDNRVSNKKAVNQSNFSGVEGKKSLTRWVEKGIIDEKLELLFIDNFCISSAVKENIKIVVMVGGDF